MNTDKKTLTQTALILKHLKEGNSITALDARKTGKKIKIKEYKLHVTSWQTYRVR